MTTRNLTEPRSDDNRRLDPLELAVAELRQQLHLLQRTGKAYIRVHSNQGGITAAKVFFEEPVSSQD